MAQRIRRGARSMVDEAMGEIETISAAEAQELFGRDDVVFVDIRDVRELQREGRVPGAVHAPRGMLEFWIDPDSQYHKPVFSEEKRFVFFCAGGLRSALAAQTASRMGMEPVCHMEGGFRAWREAGGATEPMPERKA